MAKVTTLADPFKKETLCSLLPNASISASMRDFTFLSHRPSTLTHTHRILPNKLTTELAYSPSGDFLVFSANNFLFSCFSTSASLLPQMSKALHQF